IEDGVNGFLARPRDPDDIAMKINMILENTELRKIMGQRAREKALLYSWEKITDKVENYYYELIVRYKKY
ncbi:MAG: glycosyltransferase family 1 protein, partial [candidate division WOR-3 bacterium]|nr:glycosyltransferase family 1 protein [candidate division WOR-3 bacterium]MDW7987543.1 glycosyltransferase family 1 protein [candidate division WOR-3 bacterium]